ncbi:MAG: hypothetical protein HY331_18415 [Chloroflexi bacterium]|nr:hypothetical protein [Chloroflexota bacterium]
MPARDFETQRILEERPWAVEPLEHLELALKHYLLQGEATDPAEAHRQALRHLDDALILAFGAYLSHHDEAGLPDATRRELRAAQTLDGDRLFALMGRYGPGSFTRTEAQRLAEAHRLRLAAEADSTVVPRSVVEATADLAVEQFRDLFGLRIGFRHRSVEAILAGDADEVGRMSLAESLARVWADPRTRPTLLIAGLAVILLTAVYCGGLIAIVFIQ